MQNKIKQKNYEALLSIGGASEYLGVSIDTLRRWERKEKIVALRSPGGHRYFKRSELDKLFGKKYERDKEKEPRKIEKKSISEEKEKPIATETVTKKEIPDRQPRNVSIPPTSPIKVIKGQPTAFQTQTKYIQPQQKPSASQIQQSVLTPPTINVRSQAKPISSVPPATPLKQEVLKKRSNAWIYLTFGLIILIVGFSIFVIFRSPAEVLSPVP